MLSMMTGCQANHLCQRALSLGLILILRPSRFLAVAIHFRHLPPCEAIGLQTQDAHLGKSRLTFFRLVVGKMRSGIA